MSQPTDPLFQQARSFHSQGRLDEAETLYRQLIAAQPMAAGPRHMLGVLRVQQGRNDEALELVGAALKLNSNDAEAHANYGTILRNLKRAAEALASFDRALALRPDLPGPNYNRANVLLLDLNRPQEALAGYDRALAANPNFPEAWNNRGNALTALGRLEEALASFDHALALRPDDIAALNCKAQALLEAGRSEEALALFRHSALLAHGSSPSPPAAEGPPHKQRHDREQREHQATLGGKPRAGARLNGPAVTRTNHQAAERQWQDGAPQMAVIDNLLTPEALESLRRFCREEPVWRRSYENGYLGAFPETGFACPLLAQIAEELRAAFPEIFRAHPLLYVWGFKYDSTLTGINIHADEAAVNVNFWLTPDDANLDPEGGGLVVWDVAAPLDWNFAKFNADTPAIRKFLGDAGAKKVVVPHRANRAVMFDSDLFHETDKIRFKDGYLNRRINVTMLFGVRGKS